MCGVGGWGSLGALAGTPWHSARPPLKSLYAATFVGSKVGFVSYIILTGALAEWSHCDHGKQISKGASIQVRETRKRSSLSSLQFRHVLSWPSEAHAWQVVLRPPPFALKD